MTLISAAELNQALGLPSTSSPILLNGWVAADPVAVWEDGDRVRVAGTVQHGPSGTPAFVLDEGQRPCDAMAFEGVTITPEGDVTAPADEPIAAEFPKVAQD